MKKYLIVIIAIACLLSSCSLFGSDTSENKFGETSPDLDIIVGTWVSEFTELRIETDGYTRNIYSCTIYTFYSDGKLDKQTLDMPSQDINDEPLTSFEEYGTYKIYPGSEQLVITIARSSEFTYTYSIEQNGDEYYLMLDDMRYKKD